MFALIALLVPILLGSCVHASSSEQSLTPTLDAADQQLDALTSRMVSLTDKLDGLLKQRGESAFMIGRLAKRMDRSEGSYLIWQLRVALLAHIT